MDIDWIQIFASKPHARLRVPTCYLDLIVSASNFMMGMCHGWEPPLTALVCPAVSATMGIRPQVVQWVKYFVITATMAMFWSMELALLSAAAQMVSQLRWVATSQVNCIAKPAAKDTLCKMNNAIPPVFALMVCQAQTAVLSTRPSAPGVTMGILLLERGAGRLNVM